MIALFQRDAMDCGPSCLAMISAHYGRKIDRDMLRHLCSLGKDGVSLLGISKAAETIGLKTVGGPAWFRHVGKRSAAALHCPLEPKTILWWCIR